MINVQLMGNFKISGNVFYSVAFFIFSLFAVVCSR